MGEYLGYARFVSTDIYCAAECADVYTKDGRYMFSCPPTEKAALSHAEAMDENMAALSKEMIRKARARQKVTGFTEEVKMVAEAIYNDYPERYGNVCRETRHVKERTNEERERALKAKAREEGKAARREPSARLNDDTDEYTRMKEELYKNRQI